MIDINKNKEFFNKHPDIIDMLPRMNNFVKYVQNDINGNIIEYWEEKDGILIDFTDKMIKLQQAEKIKEEIEKLKKHEAWLKRQGVN